jgi:hypothetical protein
VGFDPTAGEIGRLHSLPKKAANPRMDVSYVRPTVPLQDASRNRAGYFYEVRFSGLADI